MSPILMAIHPLRASRRLVVETRAEFRETGMRHLQELVASGADTLVIELADVEDSDIGGVGILVLLQKRARERGVTTRLLNTPAALERLLSLTQLDFLFEFDD
jgi:anti-anti-sigma factor